MEDNRHYVMYLIKAQRPIVQRREAAGGEEEPSDLRAEILSDGSGQQPSWQRMLTERRAAIDRFSPGGEILEQAEFQAHIKFRFWTTLVKLLQPDRAPGRPPHSSPAPREERAP